MGKDLQRALLWVILFTSCFLLWDNYQVYQGKPSFFHTEEVHQEAAVDQAVPAETASAAEDVAAPVPGVKDPVTVTTDLQKITFDREGGVIVGTELIRVPNLSDWKDIGLAGLILGNKEKSKEELGNVVLLQADGRRTYTSQTGLAGGDFPNHKDRFELVSQKLDMGSENNLEVVFRAEKNGVVLTRTYTFTRGEYAVKVRTDVENTTAVAIKPTVYYQLTRDASKPDGESSVYSTYTGMAFYTDEDKFQKVPFEDIADQSASLENKTDNGWFAVVQHHFVSAWLPKEGEARDNYVRPLANGLYAAGTLITLPEVAPGAKVSDEARFYSGPQTQTRLEALAPGLELVVDYGWLTFLAKPIYWLLSFLHGIVGNWGWAIVLLTCIVKAILYPISAAGYRSMARMKEVTPRMKAIQEKYKDDKQRLNQAMMELYRSEKINPVGGCLPIMLQIPVFLALYWVLQGSVELRGSSWIFWVQDLALPDPWFVLPALMAATMFLQIFLNPKPTDPVQAKVMYIMPLVFSVMFFIFASGLVLYWLTNNVLSIIQQWWINKTIAAERQKRMK